MDRVAVVLVVTSSGVTLASAVLCWGIPTRSLEDVQAENWGKRVE